jgi:hypothetical protein
MQIRVDPSKGVVVTYVVAKTATREEASDGYFRVVFRCANGCNAKRGQ